MEAPKTSFRPAVKRAATMIGAALALALPSAPQAFAQDTTTEVIEVDERGMEPCPLSADQIRRIEERRAARAEARREEWRRTRDARRAEALEAREEARRDRLRERCREVGFGASPTVDTTEASTTIDLDGDLDVTETSVTTTGTGIQPRRDVGFQAVGYGEGTGQSTSLMGNDMRILGGTRRWFVGGALGPSFDIDNANGTAFKLEENFGYRFAQINMGGLAMNVFAGAMLGQAMNEYVSLNFDGRVGADVPLWGNRDFQLYVTPTVSAGLGVRTTDDDRINPQVRERQTQAGFNLQLAAQVEGRFLDGMLGVYVRPIGIDMFFREGSWYRYDLLAGVNVYL